MVTKEQELFNEQNERIYKLEEAQLEHLNDRMKHLDEELVLRQKLSAKPLNPNYEYETDEEWLKHIVDGVKLAVGEEKIKIQSQVDNILYNRQQRDLRKQIMEEKSGNDY